MIYTLTLNPSLDYTVRLDSLRPGELNRTAAEDLHPGGKGINVSRMLAHLGYESCAWGFIAGFTGEEIARGLTLEGIRTDFIRTAGVSRINVKVKADKETEINGSGPVITDDDKDKLLKKLDGLGHGDWLVLSGSVARGLPGDWYAGILKRLSGRGIRFVVDAEGTPLRTALAGRPFLVKPNGSELSALLEKPVRTKRQAAEGAVCLRELGARNVLVSLGGDGAVLAAADGGVYGCDAPKGQVVDTVGSGDSMVAGFLSGWLENVGDSRAALRMAVAAGSASAFSPGLATKKEVERVLERTEVPGKAGKAETDEKVRTAGAPHAPRP